MKCKHIKQIQQIQTIGNIPVRVVEKEKGIKGVIYGVPLEMTEAEILHNLKSQQVITASHMTKKSKKESTENEKSNHAQPHNAKSPPQRSPSTNIILTFDRFPYLPKSVFVSKFSK